MNLQRDDITTRQVWEQHIEKGDNQWILGNPTTTSKMGSLNASIATSIDIWQRNAKQRRKNGKHKHALNATRRGTLPRTAKESR